MRKEISRVLPSKGPFTEGKPFHIVRENIHGKVEEFLVLNSFRPCETPFSFYHTEFPDQ